MQYKKLYEQQRSKALELQVLLNAKKERIEDLNTSFRNLKRDLDVEIKSNRKIVEKLESDINWYRDSLMIALLEKDKIDKFLRLRGVHMTGRDYDGIDPLNMDFMRGR